ncbi:MAG: hypothetical protein ACXW30_02350 [Micavibrio sp.]
MYQIPRWLKPQDKYAPYFKKDETGREIYYPWGDAGDAYYLRQGDKAVLKTFFRTSLLIGCLFGGVLVWVIPAFFIAPAVVISFVVIGIAWLIFHFFYKGGMESIKSEVISPCQKNPRIIRELVELAIFQIFLIFLHYLQIPYNPFLGLAAFIIVLYPLVIWFIWHRKGYIFQEKPPSI